MKPKICKIHGLLDETQCWKEKTKSGGYTRRCKLCRTQKRALKILNGDVFTCIHHGELKIEDVKPSGQCRICHNLTAGRSRNKDRTKVNEWAKIDREKNPDKYKKWNDDAHKAQKLKWGKLLSLKKCCVARGITLEQYHKILEDQKEVCAICHQPERRICGRTKQISRLVIDHCHETGKVRGLLCHDCNTGIGKLREDPIRLLRAIRYIKESGFIKSY